MTPSIVAHGLPLEGVMESGAWRAYLRLFSQHYRGRARDLLQVVRHTENYSIADPLSHGGLADQTSSYPYISDFAVDHRYL